MEILGAEARPEYFVEDCVSNLAIELKGNTLILYSRVETHGAILYEQINNTKHSNRKAFFVHGGVGANQRESIREITEN